MAALCPPVSAGQMGVFGGPSSSNGAFCLHLMCTSKEPDLLESDAFGLRSSRGKRRLEEEREGVRSPAGGCLARRGEASLEETFRKGGSRTGEPSLMPAESHVPSARSSLRPGCGRLAFFFSGGGVLLKSPIGALWNQNVKGN